MKREIRMQTHIQWGPQVNVGPDVYKPRGKGWNGSFPHWPQKEPILWTPWSWTSSLQNHQTLNLCCLSHWVCASWLAACASKVVCSLKDSTLHLYWVPNRGTYLVDRENSCFIWNIYFPQIHLALIFLTVPFMLTQLIVTFVAFIKQLGKELPAKREDPTLYFVLCSVNQAHNFRTYEMLSMPRTHLLSHIWHCPCSGFHLHLYVNSYLGRLINTQWREGSHLPEAFSSLQLLLFLADPPHWSKNRRKMSLFNRDFIQDMAGSRAMTALPGAVVKPGDVCEQCPGDVILQQSLPPPPSVVQCISHKIVFKHGTEICLITSILLWVRHLLDVSKSQQTIFEIQITY